jgi:hypothetical protein
VAQRKNRVSRRNKLNNPLRFHNALSVTKQGKRRGSHMPSKPTLPLPAPFLKRKEVKYDVKIKIKKTVIIL